jgi:hypothetical protein
MHDPAAFGRPYTAEEDKLLGTMPDEDLARQLDRPPDGVAARRVKLGIDKFNAQRLAWTKEEDALLGIVPDEEIARALDRTINSVRDSSLQTAHRQAGSEIQAWTPDEDRLLGTQSDVAVAKIIGRKSATVRLRRLKVGYSRGSTGLGSELDQQEDTFARHRIRRGNRPSSGPHADRSDRASQGNPRPQIQSQGQTLDG